jgi:3-oxoacyl-(acyl-carrier-protein) synthase
LRRVVVTGAGTINALGGDWRTFLAGLAEGRSGIGPLTLFDTSGYRCRIAAEVPQVPLPELRHRPTARRLSRSDALAIHAATEAVREAGLDPHELDVAGVVMGATVGGMLHTEDVAFRLLAAPAARVRPRDAVRFPVWATAQVVAEEFRLRGPRLTVSTACTSSATALALAADMIRNGRCPIVLAGGSDSLCRTTFAGFNALQALDAEPCRPFDRDRHGLTLGEGAAVLVLEDADHARARGASPWAELVGAGLTTDAYHMTAPRPDGAAAIAAFHAALAASGTPPEAVDYINAHGTGTPANDAVETRVIKAVLGAHAHRVPISSTKSMVGHCLGSAGAIEALTSVLALRHDLVPPTLRLEQPDPQCDLDYVPGVARRRALGTVVSNSHGFGGSNSSLVFARAT